MNTYSPTSRPGRYEVQIGAPDFKSEQRTGVSINGPTVLDVPLNLAVEAQTVTVEEQAATVSVDPDAMLQRRCWTRRELEGLSDDPDELSAQLQALAGPGVGAVHG